MSRSSVVVFHIPSLAPYPSSTIYPQLLFSSLAPTSAVGLCLRNPELHAVMRHRLHPQTQKSQPRKDANSTHTYTLFSSCPRDQQPEYWGLLSDRQIFKTDSLNTPLGSLLLIKHKSPTNPTIILRALLFKSDIERPESWRSRSPIFSRTCTKRGHKAGPPHICMVC